MTHFLLADNQDITRLGLHMLIKDIAKQTESIETTDIHTRSELIAQLKEHEDAVVVLDYTQFDLYSVDELLNISHRFPQQDGYCSPTNCRKDLSAACHSSRT